MNAIGTNDWSLKNFDFGIYDIRVFVLCIDIYDYE